MFFFVCYFLVGIFFVGGGEEGDGKGGRWERRG